MKKTLLRDAIRRALLSGAAIAIAMPLHAQNTGVGAAATAAATDAPATLDTITITGSRIQRAVDNESIEPITVVTREDMQRSGVQSVADMLQLLTSVGSPAISRADALASGEATGGSFVDLRNLGAQRTLVLLNGQRLGTTTSGLADISQIPTSAVERIEVLKDGASAIYGSDAIAGVVNIITRRQVEGGEANVYFGQYDQGGDGRKQQYDVTFGQTSDTGWVTASVQYAKEDPVWAKDRKFTADSTSGISKNGVLFIGGKPNVLRDGGDPRNVADYRPYDRALDNTNANQQMTLQTGQERNALYLDMGRHLTDEMTLTVTGLYNHRETMQQIAGYPFRSGGDADGDGLNDLWGLFDPRLDPDSYYNPMPGEWTEYNRRTWELPRVTTNEATTYRIGATLSRQFDLAGLPWSWDLSAYQNTFRTVKNGTGNLLLPAAQKATGASWFNPATNRVECGTAAAPIQYGSNFGAGQCIPWNPLAPAGSGLANSLGDPELQKYLFPLGHDVGETQTRAFIANASGILGELPAGDLALAVGYEHRRERGEFSPDALRQSGLSTDLGSGNSGGQYHLDEVYGELDIPLLADAPFAKSLVLNVASRYSSYSTFGSKTRSKVGAEWRVNEDVLVRGNWGQGFRAPTIDNLYGPQNQSFENYTDPCDTQFGAAAGTAACLAVVPPNFRQQESGQPATDPNAQSNVPFISGSNADLEPETSRSLTFGVVYSPSQVDGLSVSLDWWKVRIDNAIVDDSPNAVLEDCYVRGMTERCTKFTRDPVSGEITALNFATMNYGHIETAGYDITASWRLPERTWGRLGFTWDTTYVDYLERQSSSSDTVPVQYTGWYGNFRVRSNFTTDWSYGKVGLRWTARYYSSMFEPCDPKTRGCTEPNFAAPYTDGLVSPRTRVGSNTFNDVQFRYAMPWNSTISLGVNNIFDRVGPRMYTKPNSSFDYYGGFDIGRFIYVQYQQKF